MSSHTHAPWHVDIEETWPADAPCFITAGSGGPLCIVDNREDAHLIAAAPEMYDILLDIAGYKLLDGEYRLEAEILDRMADAFKKIRGGE